MADGLGAGNGVVSAVDHRLDQGGLLALTTGILDVRTGVLHGPGTTALVTGTAATGTMTVSIAAHHWVTSRSTADGVYVGTLEAATTVNIAAAPGANSRIDVVYEKQQDTSASTSVTPDGSAGPLYGVLTGTAAVSPTKPNLATIVGAVEIATVTVAAGATATNGSGVTITNTARQTVARGAPVPVRNQAERDALTRFPFLTVLRLDTGNIEMVNLSDAWVSTYSPSWQWTDLSASATNYDWTLPVTDVWTDFLNFPISTITVPAGRTLDVKLAIPLVNVNASSVISVRLLAGGAQIGDPGVWGSGAGITYGTPGRIEASIVGTGAAVQIGAQVKASGGGGNIRGQSIAPVRVRARIS